MSDLLRKVVKFEFRKLQKAAFEQLKAGGASKFWFCAVAKGSFISRHVECAMTMKKKHLLSDTSVPRTDAIGFNIEVGQIS